MLAIQKIQISWTKSDRTPKGAVEREKIIKPQEIIPHVCKEENGYFINELDYRQNGKIYTPHEAFDKMIENMNYHSNIIETAKMKKRKLLERNKHNTWMEGRFTDDLHIPGIIVTEDGDKYRIKWYSLEGDYYPVRNGHNEDFNNRNSSFYGKNIICETAFILGNGESGMIGYNYRCVSEEEDHARYYERYVLYFVNTTFLSEDTFTSADYRYKYDQSAILF